VSVEPAIVDLSWSVLGQMVLRLFFAVLYGGAIGLEREIHHRWAGLRTHVLVTVGTAAMTLLSFALADRGGGDASRVLQGIIVGVGFIGGGAILKLEREKRIQGLTTASGIWTSAAIGLAVGSGFVVFGGILTVVVLAVLWSVRVVEKRTGLRSADNAGERSTTP
jgi:putative Mg2+ transporter-C (MgtC) family protein